MTQILRTQKCRSCKPARKLDRFFVSGQKTEANAALIAHNIYRDPYFVQFHPCLFPMLSSNLNVVFYICILVDLLVNQKVSFTQFVVTCYMLLPRWSIPLTIIMTKMYISVQLILGGLLAIPTSRMVHCLMLLHQSW